VAHCTPEQLALAALHEPLPPGDGEHLAGCPRCREEVASLRRGVSALAVPELAQPAPPVAPPPAVWAAIAARTGVTAAPRPDVVAAVGAAPVGAAPVGAAPVAAEPVAAEPAAAEPERVEPVAEVVPLRRRRSRLLIAAAAAVLVGAGIGGGAVALSRSGDDGAVVASTRLAPLGDADASGEASVVDRDGGQVLEVRLDAPAPVGGYYEVWLIDQGIRGMLPVGVVHAGRTDLPLPDGLDLGKFPLVDVSVEPLDGDPTHSGDSVARGQLPT
jgi:hypothetical protein